MSFLKKFHFRFIFLLNIFSVSTKDPRITKKYWLSRKGQPWRALIFLEMGLLFSGYLIMFSKQYIVHIFANKLKFEQLCTLSFHQFSKLEKIKSPNFLLFLLISQNMIIFVILLDYCSKSLFYSAFFKILIKKGNFVKIYLYSSSLEPT